MMRKNAWLAICGTMLSAFGLSAQTPTPNGNPGVNGYSGYAMPRYDQAPGVVPTLPNGQPMFLPRVPGGNPAPYMPYAGPGAPNSSVPAAPVGGPPRNTGEPYLVLPDDSAPLPKETIQPKPEPRTVVEALTRIAQPTYSAEPSEPYTAYEGRRYQAEARHDYGWAWTQANYIHWWVRRDATPPLLTSGTTGIFGQNGTITQVGDGGISPKEFSGIQATFGLWRDPERLQSLELTGFWVGKNSRQYAFSSDPSGSPLLAQPILAPGERALAIALPNNFAGSARVSSVMDFHGVELNVARNLLRINGWSLDSIFGVRYAYLNDTLTMNQNITVLPGGAGTFPFNGGGQPAGANILINDSFNITNHFFGGQFGVRGDWAWCRFDLGFSAKVALGANSEVAIIDGFSALNVNGSRSGAVGGVLAQPSNIGRHTSTVFGFLPELTASAGYQITPAIRVLCSYNFLYWNRIQRAGDQIDRRIDLTQVPTSNTFNPAAPALRPSYESVRTEFWAQGVNVGIELKY
jgi:hypothetical protein